MNAHRFVRHLRDRKKVVCPECWREFPLVFLKGGIVLAGMSLADAPCTPDGTAERAIQHARALYRPAAL